MLEHATCRQTVSMARYIATLLMQCTFAAQDEVLVPEPYTASSCTTEGRQLTNPKALDRVRMIVRDARTRLGLPQEE